MHMIVIGTDTHKQTHTVSAVFAGTGQLADELTAPARKTGFAELLRWARELDAERIWAIEDCRHVSGSFERFLVSAGERVVRVPPKMMGQSRKGERIRGKSDPIDARAIARAALKEGPQTLPCAHLDERALEVKLLLDHRENLVKARSEDQQRLRWHLHDMWPELQIPAGALDRLVWLQRISRRLARSEQSARVRIARELLAETAGVERFSSDAKLARLAGVAPIPVSSGKRDRHRLDRGGNRQLNCALHRIAVTQSRVHPPARAYLARKQSEGKSRREALRCLKRHLTRTVWQALRATQIDRPTQLTNTPTLRPASPLALT